MAKIRYGRQYTTRKGYPRPESQYSATTAEGVQVGTASFTHPRYEPNLSPSEDNRTLFNLHPGAVHTLAVNADYQRQGIASHMLSLVERNHGEIGHRPPYDLVSGRSIYPDALTKVDRPIPGDSPPMTYSSDLSEGSYPLFNNLVSARTGTDIPSEYLRNGAGKSVEKRNEWAKKETSRAAEGGKTKLELEYPDPAPSSPPAGKMSAAKARIQARLSATQLELPFTDGDS